MMASIGSQSQPPCGMQCSSTGKNLLRHDLIWIGADAVDQHDAQQTDCIDHGSTQDIRLQKCRSMDGFLITEFTELAEGFTGVVERNAPLQESD